MMVNVKKECPTLLLLIIILFSQNVYAFSQVTTGTLAFIRNIAQVLILLYLVIKVIQRNMIKSSVLVTYMIMVAAMILSMFLNVDFSGAYWLLECTIAFCFVTLYDVYSIGDKFEKIMIWICSIYTALYFLTMSFWNILETPICLFLEKLHIIWHHSEMMQYYMNHVTPLRSYAFFREPGVYQMFIVLALLIELFVRDRVRLWHGCVYVVAILTTRSTTGYLCLVLILGLVIVNYAKSKRSMAIVSVGIVLGSLPLIPYVLNSILFKMTAIGANSHSWLSRQASIFTNLYIWFKKPVQGVGISYIFENYEKITKDVFGLQAGIYSITDDTNTVLIFFAAFGSIVGGLFVWGTFLFCKKMMRGKLFSTCILFIIFLCLYAGEALNSTTYPYILMFIGLEGPVIRNQKGVNRENDIINSYSML